MTLLDEIVASRLRRVREEAERLPLEALRDGCGRLGPARDALARLEAWPRSRRAIVAEVKRRSPSRGSLAPGLDAARLAGSYADAGAFAISVLTEPDFFGGSLADLDAVRRAVEVPVLYKDFVADPYQVWEARSRGADLVLVIVAVLGDRTAQYVRLSREAGLEPLVEVHGAEELDLALGAGARLVGINNRDLRTFRVDLQVSRDLLSRLPAGVFGVAESGLRAPKDLDDLGSFGASAFLIGESLVTSTDPGGTLRRFVERGGP